MIYIGQGSILNLADADDPTGLQFNLEGGPQKENRPARHRYPERLRAYIGANLQTFQVAGGTVTIGMNSTYTGTRFQVDPNASLDVADDASAKFAALDGSGTVDLEGTGTSNDTTSLTIVEPAAQSDQFSGLIDGIGQLISQGNGTLTTGAIDFGDAGGIQDLLGTLIADGSVSVGTLSVTRARRSRRRRLVRLGSGGLPGRSIFDVTLNGTKPGTQYTQLVDADSTTGSTWAIAA